MQVQTGRLTSLTELSDPASAAATPSGLSVTLAAILTFTLLLAVGPEPADDTLCVNIQQRAQAQETESRDITM